MSKRFTVLLAAASIAALTLRADEEAVGGYTWTYGVSGNAAEITAVSPAPTNNVAIPSALGGVPVTGIGTRALYGSRGLTGLVIPNSVANIGEKAFYGCRELEELTVGDGVTNIGTSAFTGCRNLKYVTIPQYVCSASMKQIFPSAYTSITHVAISSDVTSIKSGAFKGCADSVFDTASIPGVTLVDGWAIGSIETLSGTLNLTGVRGIGAKAFYKCTGLTGTVVIPPGARGIGDSAFYGCTGITGVTIPASVASIGKSAFSGCKGLASIVFYGHTPAMGERSFASVSSDCTVYVKRNSSGWGVAIPGTWNGMKIAYLEETPTYAGSLDTSFAKAQTVTGAVVMFDKAYSRVGTMQVKAGKVNKKHGTLRVSAVATLLVDGRVRRFTASGVLAALDAQGRIPPVTLTFKDPIGAMTLEMSPDGLFTFKNPIYAMASATVGGALRGGERGTFRLASCNLAVPGEVQYDLLPYEEAFEVVGGKWKFAKAATVKWTKSRETGEFVRVVDVSRNKTNRSSLKINYAARTGIFKGSFKAYVLEDARNGKKRLKKYSVNVAGFVLDGVGTGKAIGKRSAGGPWPVTVE